MQIYARNTPKLQQFFGWTTIFDDKTTNFFIKTTTYQPQNYNKISQKLQQNPTKTTKHYLNAKSLFIFFFLKKYDMLWHP